MKEGSDNQPFKKVEFVEGPTLGYSEHAGRSSIGGCKNKELNTFMAAGWEIIEIITSREGHGTSTMFIMGHRNPPEAIESKK